MTFSRISYYLFAVCLAALLIVPQLNNIHYEPQTQFWAEISVFWAIIATFLVACLACRQLSVPSITLPLAIFMVYLLIQPFFVQLNFPLLNQIAAAEIFSCILLAISINSFKEKFGIINCVTLICYVLLIGGMIQSLIGFAQYIGIARRLSDILLYDSSNQTGNIFGHFGQRNHYCEYLSWSAFALIYLYVQRRIPSYLFLLLTLWFGFSLTIGASRSVIIYFGLSIIIVGIYYLRDKTTISRRLLLATIAFSAILLISQIAYPLINQLFTPNTVSSSAISRLSTSGGFFSDRRWVELAKALLVFKEHPLFGIGLSEFARTSIDLHYLFPNAATNQGLFTNSHNLISQLLAETGIVGTAIVVIGLIWVIYRNYLVNSSPELIILACMLGSVLSHSMLEYPLWYLYFLAGLIVFLSFDSPLAKFHRTKTLLITTIPIALLVYLAIANSLIFDRLVNYYGVPKKVATFNYRAQYLKKIVDNDQLASYYALSAFDNYVIVDDPRTNQLLTPQQQYYYVEKLAKFRPYPDTLIKQAKLEWNLGQPQRARELVILAVTAYPVYKNSFRKKLRDKKYRPLLELVE